MVTRPEPDISAFLKARRAALDPGELGLPAGVNRRRVPGLRREEAAQLAGISVDYYTRIEQGRTPNISDSVLDAVARALRLTDSEYAYLRDLTLPGRRTLPTATTASQQVRQGIRLLMDAMEDVPAYVCSVAMDVLAWNTLGGRVTYDFAALEPRERNLARLYFLHEEQSRSLYPEWEAGGEYMAATLRADVGRHPDDPALGALIADLLEHSAQFRRCWDQQHVRGLCYGVKHVTHPVVGELWLHYESLPLPSDPGQTLVTFTAEPGSATDKSLRLLATRATPQPVPSP
ncbi:MULTISPECIES: helix-turn-helix transcriptional regulator [unclassified Streptomyces]|jgi:transcriptional regulator with XRE-family HTH domain|uniref:helix-turn-helix transcriptional regulator n=1 Tax=unclassified Streptomyces TaxID=2593676 RepID=UPI00117D38EC|nr:helix-turn-helix transcriptional regulator [Streptomyces sp. IB201691-2A2]TRO62777.1 XRE family transcriptional regulator [Streptomyces sp. IB201691-2A2]